jgi:hypothetical protein
MAEAGVEKAINLKCQFLLNFSVPLQLNVARIWTVSAHDPDIGCCRIGS